MKKNLLNPSFEFVFALWVITMLFLPMLINFTQSQKRSFEVQFKDSDDNVLWSNKAGDIFGKNFTLPQAVFTICK